MTVWLVPPYPNEGWPELAIFDTLAARARRFDARVMRPVDPEGLDAFSTEAQASLLQHAITQYTDAVPSLMSSEDVILFTEFQTALPLVFRMLWHAEFGSGAPSPRMVGMVHGGALIGAADTLALPPMVERTVLSMYDRLIFPAHWLRTIYCEAYPKLADRFVVQRWPFPDLLFSVEGPPAEARRQVGRPAVVFPHRQVEEKGWPLFKQLMGEDDFGFDFIPLRGLSKHEFYDQLAHAAAVFGNSQMEVYGTAVEEAVTLGCCPVLNRHPAYTDVYTDAHWHDGTKESVLTALEAVRTCTIDHSALTRDESDKRADALYELALQAPREI